MRGAIAVRGTSLPGNTVIGDPVIRSRVASTGDPVTCTCAPPDTGVRISQLPQALSKRSPGLIRCERHPRTKFGPALMPGKNNLFSLAFVSTGSISKVC